MERKLTGKSLISYGVGDFYGGGSFFIIGSIFLIFLTDVGGLSPTLAGLVIMIGKVWDAITDPTMGYISDNTKSKHGRRRLYFLLGIIPIFISFALLWVSFKTGSQYFRFLYYLLVYILFNTVFTMVMVPYNSMPAEMTSDYKKRTQLIGTRMFFSQFGALIGAVLPMTIVNSFADKKIGFIAMGLFFGIMYSLPWIIVFKGTWEKNITLKYYKKESFKKEILGIFKNFLSTKVNRSFRLHIIMYLCAYVAMDIFNALLIYYIRDYLRMINYYQVVLGTVVLSEVLALYFVFKSCSKSGNAKTYRKHSLIWIVGIILFATMSPTNSIILLIVYAIITGIGLSGDVMVPYNILAFVIDTDEMITSKRREGIYSGMMTFMRKIAQAIALFMVGIGLDLVGYQSAALGVIEQSNKTILGIRAMFLIIPILLIVIGIITSLSYKISPKNHKILMCEIDRLKKGGNKGDVEENTKYICETITGVSYNKLWTYEE